MYDGFNFGGTTTNHQTTNFNSMTTLQTIWHDIMKDYTMLSLCTGCASKPHIWDDNKIHF